MKILNSYDPRETFRKQVDEIRRRDGCSRTMAMQKAVDENPSVYTEMQSFTKKEEQTPRISVSQQARKNWKAKLSEVSRLLREQNPKIKKVDILRAARELNPKDFEEYQARM